MVWILEQYFPAHKGGGDFGCTEESCIRSVAVCADWSCVFLHVHDDRRRRWEASCDQEISGSICSSFEGELPRLASRADAQLSNHSSTVSDSFRFHDWYRLDCISLSHQFVRWSMIHSTLSFCNLLRSYESLKSPERYIDEIGWCGRWSCVFIQSRPMHYALTAASWYWGRLLIVYIGIQL